MTKSSALITVSKLCGQEGVDFINMWDDFYDKAFLFQGDGLHLSDIGSPHFGRLLSSQVLLFRQKSTTTGRRFVVNDISSHKRNVTSCCMINARSIRNKFHDMEALAASEDLHIVGITVTWLDTVNRLFSGV